MQSDAKVGYLVHSGALNWMEDVLVRIPHQDSSSFP